MKWVLATVVLLVTIVVGVYWALPWVLQMAIVEQAALRGITVSNLQIRRPVWGLLIVDSARIDIGSNSLQLEAATVAYTWDSLFERRVTDVKLAAMNIVVGSDSAAPAQPVGVGELIGMVPALLGSIWETIPADSLVVEELRAASAAAQFAGTMALSPRAASVQGRVSAAGPLPALLLNANLQPDGALLAQIRDAEVTDNRLDLRADLAAATGTLTGSWHLELKSDGVVVAAQVSGSIPISVSPTGWVVRSGMVMVLQMAPWSVTVELTGAEGSWQAPADELARVTADWHLAPQPSPTGVTAQGSLAATVGSTAVLVELQPGTVATATGLAGEDWAIGSARAELVEAAELQIALAPVAYRLRSGTRLALQLDRAVWSDYQLNPAVDLTVREFDGDRAAFAASTELRVPALQLAGSARIAGSTDGAPLTAEFSAEQRLAKPLFASLWPRGKRVYDLDAGAISGRGKLRWADSALTGRMTLNLADLHAHYEQIIFTGVNGELDVGLQSGGWRAGPGEVRIGSTDVGFPVTDLAATVTLTPARATISGAHGRALGGDVTVAGLEYDIAGGATEFMLEARGVELSQLLALEGDTVTGRGILDGKVPVTIADNQIRVSDGRFSARPPGGVLSYGGAEQAAAALNQPGVSFAIAALADFRYGVLDVGLDYQPNGDLLLGIHLEGRNPRFEGGRPIHYNLNISENIPVLLESLRLSDQMSRQLEKRLEH